MSKIIKSRRIFYALLIIVSVLVTSESVAAETTTESLFQKHCASCHGVHRLGITGPALLPENLRKLRNKQAIEVIKNGRVATQMPAFRQQLSRKQIESLVSFIYTPLATPAVWGEREIRASHIVYPNSKPNAKPQLKPVFDADPMNLFLVVESGDHHVTLLDGDTFNPIHRFASRFALHGGPKYSSDGRYVYFTSRDGWISRFDIYTLKLTAEIRVGINARNAAVSSDDNNLIVANYYPHTLVVLSADDLSLVKIIPVNTGKGKSSRVSAVYNAPPRNTFVAALKDVPEVWEISYEDPPPAGFGQPWSHDYREDSGDAIRELFPVRRIRLASALDDFFFDQDYVHLVGASRQGEGQVIDLDLGRAVAKLDLPGMPHLSSGITWKYQDTTVLATPNLKENSISIIDMQTWKLIKKIKTPGTGFFLRSHEKTPYAWADVFFGENRDQMLVIDKNKLEIIKTLRPVPGKTSAHVEFTQDGSHALVSIWEMNGELVVYDASSFKVVKRIPMKKPVGKYNVYNKITHSSGTSH
ncbi:MAG: cytochrome D1 domain-containing protein [Gammaproteobacteria bacterium]